VRIWLGERALGDGARCLIVADVGSNHDGDLGRATALVDAAAESGADAVLFHSFHAELLARRRSSDGASTPRLERLELRTEWHAVLRTRALAKGLVFLATTFDVRRAELVAALGVPAMSAAATDLGQRALLAALGGFGRPILIATGGAPRQTVEAALAAVSDGSGAPGRRPPIVLVAGTTGSCAADADLGEIAALRASFGCVVGWADRAPGWALGIGAVALGASLVVKGLTDDRTRRGPDHEAALEPVAFRTFAAAAREVEAAGRRRGRSAPAGEMPAWREPPAAIESAPCNPETAAGSSPSRSSPT
jgi:sialic acid synthase SpsE